MHNIYFLIALAPMLIMLGYSMWKVISFAIEDYGWWFIVSALLVALAIWGWFLFFIGLSVK